MAFFLFARLRNYVSNFYSHYKFFRKFSVFPCPSSTIQGVDNISIKANFSFGEKCEIYARQTPHASAKIEIGENVALNSNVILNAECGGRIVIGDNVLIGPMTLIRASNHNFKTPNVLIRSQGHTPGVIEIEENVWIGGNVVILPNVKIGKNSVIAAGSIVSKNIPANSLFIQKRDSQRIDLF